MEPKATNCWVGGPQNGSSPQKDVPGSRSVGTLRFPSGDAVLGAPSTAGGRRQRGIFNLERHRVDKASRKRAGTGSGARLRPHARGKSIFVGDEKLYVRGVTYGTFAPDESGDYPSPDVVARDFAMMTAGGVNAFRTYTVPSRWLLDLAHEHGLWVMVGLPWEQHVTFLGERKRRDSIVEGVLEGVRQCGGHPAVLRFAIGNDI